MMPQKASGLGGARAAPAGAPQEAEGNVSPEEQAAYDRFVGNGMDLIYPRGEGEAISPAVMANLQGRFDAEESELFAAAEPPLEPGPKDNLAAAGASIVAALMTSARQAGAPLSGDVVFMGGVELFEQLAEIAEAAGLHDYGEEELEAALYRAVDLVRATLSEEEQAMLQEEFGQVVDADRAGRLEDVLPGIGQRMQQG